MAILRMISSLFLLPGTLVLSALNISIESDEGIFRSMINMTFWGFIAVMCALPLMIS